MASAPLRRSSRTSLRPAAPETTVVVPSDPFEIAWKTLLPVPGTGFGADFKGETLLSLMDHLNFTPRDFLDWFFISCSDPKVRQRAAQWVSPKGGNSPLVPLIQTIWEHYRSPAQSYIEEAIDPIVKHILVRESNAAIGCRALSIRPGDIHLPNLLARIGDGPESITSHLRTLMPHTVSWLLHAISADNPYRDKLQRHAEQIHDVAAETTAATGDEALPDVEDDSAEFPDEGLPWQSRFPGFTRDPSVAVTFVVSVMLFVRNRSTNALPFLLGALMSAYGASTRVVTVFSRLGAVVSVDTLDRFRVRISLDAVSRAVSAVCSDPRWYLIIDNINLYVRRLQRIVSQNFMINATNAVIVMLPAWVSRAAIEVQAFLALRGKRSAAMPDDIRPTLDDDRHMQSEFEALVQQMLLAYCPGSDSWSGRQEMKDLAAAYMPQISPLTPEVTQTFPVGVLDANEGSYKGMLRAIELLRERLNMSPEKWSEHVHIAAGDYLTSRNVRGVQFLRQFDINATERVDTILPQSQLFHFAMRAADVIQNAYLGDGARDPGSLERHKTQLKRKYDVKKADYANSKALIRHSLIARLLNCVMVLRGFSSWSQLKAWKPDYKELCQVSKAIVEKYATVCAAEDAMDSGDDVLGHSIHFIIDALRFCAFESAVSHGDAGRVLLILKYWAFDFRGAGSHNYARECVEILLRWKYELNDEMRKMWAASWFVNVWGKPGRFIASDLYLEHLNYYVKVVHLASGSGVSVDNIIRKGSSCVEALMAIADALSRFVGHSHVHRRHKEKQFLADLEVLVYNMQASGLHVLSSAPERCLGEPADSGRAKATKTTRGVAIPPLPQRAIQSLFDKGYSTWNGQYQQFVKATTWDPAIGPRPPSDASESAVELTAEDVAIPGMAESEVDSPACEGYGGLGGGSEFGTSPIVN